MGSAITEREGAISALRGIVDDAAAGNGRALFVLGEAGLGKTTLLDCAVALAGGRLHVGIGRADVAEAALPFGLLSQALEPLLGAEALFGERPRQWRLRHGRQPALRHPAPAAGGGGAALVDRP